MKTNQFKHFAPKAAVALTAALALTAPLTVFAQGGQTGMNRAKEVALKDAGFTASQVSFTKAKTDTEDGVKVYELEFYNGNTEYDYTIAVSNYKILEKDVEVHKNKKAPAATKPAATQPAPTQAANGITMEAAKEIALKDAGISPANAVFVQAKLGWENGIRVYDLEFISGAYEYDYDIAVSNGTIVDKDVDLLDD